MNSGASMPHTQRNSLARRITLQLVRILRVYVLLITVLMMAVISLGGFLYFRTELAHQQQLVSIKVGTELANAGSELQSLVSAPVVWTGLTDSFGREAYLEPLLARFNRDNQRQLVLLDYRGRVSLASNAQHALAIAQAPVVMAAVAQGRDAIGLRTSSGDMPQLLLVRRVMSPVAASPVGYLVASIDLHALVASLSLDPDLQLAFAIGAEPLMPVPIDRAQLTSQASLAIKAGDAAATLRLWTAQPIHSLLIAGGMTVLVVLLLGLLTIQRVMAWARRFAASTTRRYDQLLLDCQRLLAGEPIAAAPEGPHDELSEVTEALSGMLRQQQRLTDELRKTSLVFSTAAEGILVTDPNGRILEVNPALLAMTGYARDELMGRQAGTLYRSVGREDTSREMVEALAREGRWSGETSFLARNGRVIPTSVAISRLRDEHGVAQGNVAVITDVTRLKEAETNLRDLAYRDNLTGLPNFRRLSDEVRHLLRRAQGTRQGFAVLFFDMDQLKFVNDNYGHETGDTVIRALAAHLRAALPRGHLLCRRSGDEFIAVVDLPSAESRAYLHALLERISPIEVPVASAPLQVSVTTGVSRFPDDGEDWQTLQICADVAMNEAKQARRGSVVWFDSQLGQKVYRQRLIQSKLAHAIDERIIDVHYQPEVDLRTGQITGFEALARWTDPELGDIPPAEFVAVAEEAHLIDALSLLVVDTVLRDKVRLQTRFPGTKVALNLAPHVFLGSRLLKFLSERASHEPGLLQGLEVELTESQIASGEASLLLQLQTLTSMGVQLVIDDFGTGYSSLSRLTQFPISRLKIDRSFVASLDLPRQAKIARLIINLAKVLGFEVTAEGVETAEQRESLLAMGCRRAQGWLFAKAMPLVDAVELADAIEPHTSVTAV